MEYIQGSEASECIFNNHDKTYVNLFSPGSAVSCIGDTPVSDIM